MTRVRGGFYRGSKGHDGKFKQITIIGKLHKECKRERERREEAHHAHAQSLPESVVVGELVHVPVEWKDSTQQFLGTQKLKNVLHYFCVENTHTHTRIIEYKSVNWRRLLERAHKHGGRDGTAVLQQREENEAAYQWGGRPKIQASWWPRPIDAASVRVPLGTSRQEINWGIE